MNRISQHVGPRSYSSPSCGEAWQTAARRRRWAMGRLVFGVSLTLQFCLAAAEYREDGEPTPREEQIRWLVNRARFSPDTENQLRETDYDVPDESLQPLAPDQALLRASRRHCEDMARTGIFQHETPGGSAFYPEGALPWDRAAAEGYESSGFAENIAAGYTDGRAAHNGWWRSDGHRRNLLRSSWRELGVGYFQLNGSPHQRYYVENFAVPSSAAAFFTDTIFHDRNGNGEYDEGEGLSGLEIRLRVNSADHDFFDRSTSSGSFAIPHEAILAGTTVEVVLKNPGSEPIQISIPSNASSLRTQALASYSEVSLGIYHAADELVNVGFRNLQPPPTPEVRLQVQFRSASGEVELTWPAESSACSVQYTSGLAPQALWFEVETAPVLDGAHYRLTLPTSGTQRHYRLNCR